MVGLVHGHRMAAGGTKAARVRWRCCDVGSCTTRPAIRVQMHMGSSGPVPRLESAFDSMMMRCPGRRMHPRVVMRNSGFAAEQQRRGREPLQGNRQREQAKQQQAKQRHRRLILGKILLSGG